MSPEAMEIDLRKGGQAFNLQKMEDIYRLAKGIPDNPHRHEYYTLLYVQKAAGTHQIDYETYTFETGQVHFVAPGQVHRVLLTEQPEGYVISFTREFLVSNNIPESFISNINLFKPFGVSPPLLVDDHTKERLTRIIGEMQECFPLDINYRMRAMGALLQLFLIYCHNSSRYDPIQNDEQDRTICILRNFKELVDKNFRIWHKLSHYAEAIHISSKHLSSTVKDQTGKTAKTYIQDRLMLEAKRMLLHTDSSIGEIARELGFEEPLHFSAFFKKCEGLSPRFYRRKKANSEIFI